ncbi:MAG: DUF87 domain-containing protein, partial [Burkholderiales bacterium]|nr:DUF87 domain-containing protein [Anaerolineae bacterium]
EHRSLDRTGRGGGYIAWALSSLVSGQIVSETALVIYSDLLFLSMGIVIGIQRKQIVCILQVVYNAGDGFGQRMKRRPERKPRKTRERIDKRTGKPEMVTPSTNLDSALEAALVAVEEDAEVQAQQAALKRLRTGEIMRIRPNLADIPPSQRPGAMPNSPTDTARSTRVIEMPQLDVTAAIVAARADGTVTTDKPSITDTGETREFLPRRERIVVGEFNAIGTLKGKRGKDGTQSVERPDGRLKRFFSVQEMKEAKRVGRRKGDMPPLEILRDLPIELPEESEINTNVVLIENTLLEFDIDIDVVDVRIGPTVTQYAVQPFKEIPDEEGALTPQHRTRISKIASLASDLALTLSAKRLRMETPVPGHTYIGIEVPNKKPSTVALRSVYESRTFFDALQKAKTPLMIPLGRDVSGTPVAMDIGEMPHVLIAGTTGSGKSVAIAAMTTALVLNNAPDEVKLILLDPKMVELSRFNGLPHLLGPVETDLDRIIGVLRWATREMDRRYEILERTASRNLATYNQKRAKDAEHLPFMVIMIDEIGDLMLSRPEETEHTVTRLAQKARAVGMHLVVATQRPSVDVITGLIKANFPARVAFSVASGVDSRVILDSIGAETLMGKGDMLYLAPDAAGPRRLQGCYVSDDEVRAIVDWWKTWHKDQIAKGKSERIYNGPWERALTRRELLSETDPMLEDAIGLCIAEGEASASLIQRKLNIGYPRAARIMDMLEELGMVGEVKAGGRSREVLIKPGQDPFKDVIDKRTKNT